jgi:hypothetical protein
MIEKYQISATKRIPNSNLNFEGSGIALHGVSFNCHDDAQPRTGAPLTVRVSYESDVSMDDVVFTVSFIWPSGYICTELVSPSTTLAAGRGHVVFDCPILAIQRGLYTIDLAVTTISGRVLAKRIRAAPFRVDPGLIVQGDFYMTHSARLEQSES